MAWDSIGDVLVDKKCIKLVTVYTVALSPSWGSAGAAQDPQPWVSCVWSSSSGLTGWGGSHRGLGIHQLGHRFCKNLDRCQFSVGRPRAELYPVEPSVGRSWIPSKHWTHGFQSDGSRAELILLPEKMVNCNLEVAVGGRPTGQNRHHFNWDRFSDLTWQALLEEWGVTYSIHITLISYISIYTAACAKQENFTRWSWLQISAFDFIATLETSDV